MRSIPTKKRGNAAVDDGNFPLIPYLGKGFGNFSAETQTQLVRLVQEVTSALSDMDASRKEELLYVFVLEMLRFSKEQELREERRRKQAEKIAAAKARGVHFGPQPKALPEGFEALRQAWREKQITLQEAAAACGLPKSTFRDAALRAERGETA